MTVPDAVSNLFVESLKLSAKQRKVLDIINEHPRGITAARIATIMGTTVNPLRGHLDDIGRTWARQISTEPCDESELLVRLAQMGFDPVPVEESRSQADTQLAAPLAEQSDTQQPKAPGAPGTATTTDRIAPDRPGRPIIKLRSCPFLHPHKDTPATVCDIHMGMLAARTGPDGQHFTLTPHHGDALCHIMAIDDHTPTANTGNSPP